MNKRFCIAAVFALPYAIFTAGWLYSLHHPFGVHMLVFYPTLAIQELPKIAQETFNYGKWPGIYIAMIFAAIAVFGLLIYFILLYFSFRRASLIAIVVASIWLIVGSLLWSFPILFPGFGPT